MSAHLLVGFGVTNQAVADALTSRGESVLVTDDSPSDATLEAARGRGLELVVAPDEDTLTSLIREVDVVLPSPGLGDVHPSLAIAARVGAVVRSELDLAAAWDDRPVVAITGTDGKTTVTTLVTDILNASGVCAFAAGNTEVPLVSALDDATVDVFVVEASSFRLAHSERFAPLVGTWLNATADHVDLHGTLSTYIAAKERIWRDQSYEQWAVGNADDPTVAGLLSKAPGKHVTFGLGEADYRATGDELLAPSGVVLASRRDLFREFPHDVSNALAACATAMPAGATVDGCGDALRAFRGLPHRITLVADRGDVRWYDDSKATTPGAALAAIRSFPSVVLIAGGRNKGVDLRVLAEGTDHVRSVVAIGEAAPEIEAAFSGIRPTTSAESMGDAVAKAGAQARAGDVVLLSPACASFDWYGSYAERGDDFARHVNDLVGGSR